MNKAFILILFLFVSVFAYSQKIQKVAATYTYYAPETMSVEEAKRTALDRAKIQAIADEFGTTVSQSTSTMVSNKDGESVTQFFSIGGSDVKGEWIETIGEPEYDIQVEKHFLIVKCKVKGKVREINQAKIEYVAKPLRNGTTPKYESTEFRDGDDLYLYFRSPTAGFLSVYLLDDNSEIVYQILPYQRSDGRPVDIIQNREYVFFSKKIANIEDREFIDEYRLNCHQETEHNTLFLIFSTEDFSTAICNEGDVSVPNFLSKELFTKWLTYFKNKYKNCKIIEEVLTIR